MTNEQIAQVCHESNRAFCAVIGDNSQKPWEEAENWQRESAIEGVKFSIANPDASAADQHDSWLAEKVKNGWVYGPEKDSEKKTHPCCVPYDQLPKNQKLKDYLFKAIVNVLK
jgi:hypothetical protein